MYAKLPKEWLFIFLCCSAKGWTILFIQRGNSWRNCVQIT